MKVIGGKYKGLSLEMLNSPLTRPTKAILKESLFNVLHQDIVDSIFIEAFGGSGSVGIEAISRGASKAIFIEHNPPSFRVLKSNLSKLKLDVYNTYFGDTFEILPPILSALQAPTILYLDPPFCIREKMQDIYEKCFDLAKNIQNSQIFLLIFEHLSSYEMPKKLGNFCIIKHKKFGKSSLSYYLKES